MQTAHPATGPASPPRQGAGPRLVRRLGSAVRSAVAGGITLAGNLRRPAASHAGRQPPAPESTQPPPVRPRTPRRPAAAAPVPSPQPAHSGWLARWFGRARPAPMQPEPQPSPQPAPARRRRSANSKDAPFTPETCPGLPPEICAFLNTPVDKCDPDILSELLNTLARHIATSMPPELGLTDAGTVLSTLRGRLDALLGEAGLDALPGAQQHPAPATPADAEPDPPSLQPAPLPEAQGTHPADDASTVAVAAWETTPDAASLLASVSHGRRSPRRGSRSFPRRRGWPVHRIGPCFRHEHSELRRGLRRTQQALPSRRLSYAACAGPP